MNRLGLLAVLAAFLVPSISASPAVAEPRINVHAGASLPGGDFGGTDDPGDGGARPGYAITVELEVDVGGGGLIWSSLAGVQSNGFDDGVIAFSDSALAHLRDDLGEDELPGFTVDKGSWWSVPVLTGIRYQRPLGESLAVFVSGHVGAAVVSTPTLEWTYTNQVDRVAEESFEWDVTPAFAVGAGAYIDDRFTVSGRAYFLGSPDVTTTREYFATSGDDSGDVIWTDTNAWDMSVSMITLQFGIRFDN